MQAKLKTAIWVNAQIRVADQAGRSGMVLRKGDADSGAVLVVLRDRGGRMVVLSETSTEAGDRAWMRATGPGPVSQDEADRYVERRARFDSDLWVLEFDAPDLSPPFDATVL